MNTVPVANAVSLSLAATINASGLVFNAVTVALASNAVCNPVVLAIVRSPSVIVACLPSIAVCNPVVFAILSVESSIT